MKDRNPEDQSKFKRKFSEIGENRPRRDSRKFVYSHSGLPIPEGSEILGKGNRKKIKDEIEGLFLSVLGKNSFYGKVYYFYDEVKVAVQNKILPEKLISDKAHEIKFEEGQLRVDHKIVISSTDLIYKKSVMIVPFNAVIELHHGGRMKRHEGNHVLAVYAFLNRIKKELAEEEPVKNKRQKLGKEEKVPKKKTMEKTETEKIVPKVKFPYRVVPYTEGSKNRHFSIFAMEDSYAEFPGKKRKLPPSSPSKRLRG